MPIQTKRNGSDSVEIFADDQTYYEVGYSVKDGRWTATKYHRSLVGLGTRIGNYETAEEAVEAVKTMLSEREAQLTAALHKLL